MPRKPLNKETQAYKNKLAYIHKVTKTYEKYYFTFNPNTEQDMIDWMKDKDPKASYIKSLIRKDMLEHQK